MDFESAFISRVVNDGLAVKGIEAQITPTFFEDRVNARVWGWIVNFWNEYGASPTRAAFAKNYPAYELLDVEEPFQYLLDELRTLRKFTLLQTGLLDAAQKLNDTESTSPVEEAQGIIAARLEEINTSISELRDTNIVETWDARMKKYQMYKDTPSSLRGITTGFDGLDRLTSGFQPEQFIIIVAPPKAGKSTALIAMALAAHRAGKVPLLVGFEMSNEEQEARHDAMLAHVDYRKLLAGQLNSTDMERLRQALRKRRNMQPFILSSDINSATTVSGLSAKVAQYRPDIVYVDGAYMMDAEGISADKGSPQYITHITRSIKRAAQRLGIPIVATTQALTWKINKKSGISADSTGYSSSFGQDCDTMIGIDPVIGLDGLPNDNERKFKVMLSRSGPNGEMRVKWDWTSGDFEELQDTYSEGEEDDEAFSFAEFAGRSA